MSFDQKRVPVLEGDLDTLRRGLRERPLPPGLHERPLQPGLQPDEEGTSFSQMETLTKQGYHLTLKMETLTKPRYHLTLEMETLVKKRDHLSMKAVTKQRNHLRKMVSFHFIPILLVHVRKDLHFTQKIRHLQLYVFRTLVAREPWDLGKQLMHFAEM